MRLVRSKDKQNVDGRTKTNWELGRPKQVEKGKSWTKESKTNIIKAACINFP